MLILRYWWIHGATGLNLVAYPPPVPEDIDDVKMEYIVPVVPKDQLFVAIDDESKPFLDEDVTVETKCPFGWTAWYEYCFSLMEVIPYTKCPTDPGRFHSGLVNELSVGLAGVCQWTHVISPDLLCPDGYILEQSDGIELEPLKQDTELDAEDLVEQNRQLTEGDSPESLEGPDDDFLAKTKKRKIENVICRRQPCDSSHCPTLAYKAGEYLVPQVICPAKYEPFVQEVDPYNHQPRMYQRCRKYNYVKGKEYCPPGFDLFAATMSHFEFGEAIDDDYNLEESDPLSEVLGYGAIDVLPPNSGSAATCLQIVSTHRELCDKYTCKNDVMIASERIVKGWAFAKLESDPDLAWYYASPSGKNLKYTPIAKHYIPKPGKSESFLEKQDERQSNTKTLPQWTGSSIIADTSSWGSNVQ